MSILSGSFSVSDSCSYLPEQFRGPMVQEESGCGAVFQYPGSGCRACRVRPPALACPAGWLQLQLPQTARTRLSRVFDVLKISGYRYHIGITFVGKIIGQQLPDTATLI